MKPSEIYEQTLEDIKSGKVDRDEMEQFLIKSITKEEHELTNSHGGS